MMGIENVYGALLNGLQSENQKLLLTKLKKDGTLEKHMRSDQPHSLFS